MKHLLVTLFLFISFLASGQSVNAPEAKSFIVNTTGQDASGFSLSGFSSTATLLCAIGLPTAPSGTTFYMTTTTGLTAASGYTMSGNKTRLAFTGTMANINAALATLKVNTTGTSGTIQLSVSATVNPTGYFYNPSNGHFYRPISTGQTYPNAKTLSSQQTFKGQQGYLVTITSADEDAFIFNNVPQGNIWFALTDEVVEAQWRIDAGPEAGTLIKTSNGQTAGNIVGQYNNWAGGEPNNSGNEDYAVTKWGGGSQWNDLPAHFSCAYVVEFGTWTNPDDATFTEFYSNSVNHSNGNVLRVQFQYDFGTTLNETLFKTKLFSNHNNIQQGTMSYTALNSLGKIDMTNGLDQTKVSDGKFKATTSGGQVEWCVVYDYEAQNQRYQILIDKREFPQGTLASDVTSLQLFDLWNGPVTYQWDDGTWAAYWIYTPTQFNFAGSSFTSNIRRASFFWGLSAEFTFTPNTMFKPHFSDMQYSSNHASLFNSIVTVGDVYLAFKQLSDNGIFGNSNVHFTTPIQFANADVDSSGVFNEQDCFILLKHLLGETTIWSNTSDLSNMVKFIGNSEYDAITNNNWQNYRATSTQYNLPSIVDGQLNSYNVAVTWKGDVNLSHSALPNGITQPITNSMNQIATMSVKTQSVSTNVVADIWMESKGDVIEVTIDVVSNGNTIGATQFVVNFDSTNLEYIKSEFSNKTDINFARKDIGSVNIGTLNTSGNTIGASGYKLTFKPIKPITNILGLISVESIETIDTKSNKLNVIVQ